MIRWLLALVLAVAACAPTPTPEPTTEVAVPAPTPEPTDEAAFTAPDFALSTLDGATVRLSDLRGQWVIVNFWATWCGPCVAEMPALVQIAEAHRDRLLLLAVNMREPVETVTAFLDEQGLSLTVLVAPDDAVLTNYQVLGLPQTVVVAPDGDIVWRQFGPVEVAVFEDTLTRLMG